MAKLEMVLAQGADDLTKVVPLMADLLSIPTGDRYPPLDLPPQKRKERTLHISVRSRRGTDAPARADGVRGRALERSHHPRGA